jgi:hypothetical protein
VIRKRKNNMAKIKAVTIFFSGTVQEKIDNKIIATNQTAHFEVGLKVNEGTPNEKTVIYISEFVWKTGVKVVFSDGIIWRYKGFNYIIS